MSLRNNVPRACLIVASAAVVAIGAFGADFTTLPLVGDGTNAWEPSGMSTDGSVVTGGLWFEQTIPTGAFRWTRADGFLELDGFGGVYHWMRGTRAVSGDGSTIFGTARPAGTTAFVPAAWTTAGDIGPLIENPPVFVQCAWGASFDGSAVVGSDRRVWPPAGGIGWYWRADQGLVDYALPPGAYVTSLIDIAADGSSFVGSAEVSGQAPRAFLWTDDGTIVTQLPAHSPPGENVEVASEISADGRVVAGYTAFDPRVALRWDGITEPEVLGSFIPGGISGDGSIVVGDGFVWRDATGTTGLGDYLGGFGIDVSGWTYLRATAISDDGFTIGGSGVNPLGQRQGWIATVPEPNTSLLLIAGLAFFVRRRGRQKSLWTRLGALPGVAWHSGADK